MDFFLGLFGVAVLLREACVWISPDLLEKRMIRLSARRRYILAGREAAAIEADRMRESYGLKGVA